MRRFSYRLEPVRRLRQQEEQLVQVELAAVLRQRAVADEALQASRRAEHDLYEWLRQGNHSAAELAHVARYDELHRRRIIEAEHHLMGIDGSVGRVRQRLAIARQRSEALEKHRERAFEEHRQAGLAEEGRELDEIATMRAARALLARPEASATTGWATA